MRLHRQPERGTQSIEGVHRRDRDGEIDQVLRREGRSGCGIGGVGGMGPAARVAVVFIGVVAPLTTLCIARISMRTLREHTM